MFSKRTLFFCLTIGFIQYFQLDASPIRPYRNYTYSTELQPDLANLWWSIDDVNKEITFEFHMKTTGWIALGISPAGGMNGADIGLGWVDQHGKLHFEDRYATGERQPMVDNTTVDWFGMKGREENGWTAIQFKRLLDTCDYMDVPIKSGTNILIYTYSLEDPQIIDGKASISYHGNRRFTRAIPLQSYGNPPADSKFDGLDYFEFKLNNYHVPADKTTYYCQIYKAPAKYTTRRHAIAYKTLIDSGNQDIVHHLLMYECDPKAVFDDNNLPHGLCNNMYRLIAPCASNIATGWAVGGDFIGEFPDEAGYPVGGDFEIKYYMLQMHYNNPKFVSNRTDSSGIRYYVGNQLRQHDIGYLTFGADSSVLGIAIPPRTDEFIIDSYCPAEATSRIHQDGITVIASFPHTHLQGRSLWTKLIRNQTAVGYLFDAESYDFNYQFRNDFPTPIKLYPGDEFATRCVYSTTDKDVMTVGGEATSDEMCLHMFIYYPRMNNIYGCMNVNHPDAWAAKLNISAEIDYDELREQLLDLKWNSESIADWQKFFNEASRGLFYGSASNMTFTKMDHLPKYKDLDPETCKKQPSSAISVKPLSILAVFIVQLCILLFL